MKVLTILAVAAFALAPALADAQNTTQQNNQTRALAGTPTPGGVGQAGALPVFSLGALPAGAVVVGGVVIVAGVVVGVVAATDDSTTATTTTQ